MTNPDDRSQSGMHKRYKYGPLRILAPIVAVVVGVVMLFKGFTASGGIDTLFVILGIGALVMAGAAVLVYRSMAKRGL